MNIEILDLKKQVEEILDKVYPVGSIYMTVSNVSPQTLFGGTWTKWGTGRTIVGVDSANLDFEEPEMKGGEAKHTLTISEIPSHYHTLGYDIRRDATSFGNSGSLALVTGGTVADTAPMVSPTGNGQPISLMQPYITCYMWKRVA